jgi:hypothetical protein
VMEVILIKTSKCFQMVINVELGLIICKMYVRACSVKVKKAGTHGVLSPGLWSLPGRWAHLWSD